MPVDRSYLFSISLSPFGGTWLDAQLKLTDAIDNPHEGEER